MFQVCAHLQMSRRHRFFESPTSLPYLMRLRSGLLALIALLPGLAAAQEAPAVLTARTALQSTLSARGVASTDLADLAPTDVVFDRRSASTFVYLAQRVNGVEVWATQTPVVVDAAGRAVSPASTAFEFGLAARANAPTPAVEAAAAAARAEAHVARLVPAPHIVLTDDPATDAAARAAREVRFTADEPRLVYQPVPGGALRLAWSMVLTGGSHLWAVRVDAATGTVLAADDLVAYDAWGEAAHAPASFVPVTMGSALGAVSAPSSYRVVGMPFESPNHGPFSLVVNPADPVASQNGWHDIGAVQYTITRGNNAYAYTDREPIAAGSTCQLTPGCNQPDPGSSPDGGANLVFDNAFDPAQGVTPNQAAAVTSVFYWGNIVHDVTYRYGFDEAGGNFQTNNFGRGGAGNDAVNLEALDGSGTNNANFSSPADGGAGRMQMFEWTAVPVFQVTAPASIAGQYPVGTASFGGPPTFSGSVVPAGPIINSGNQACTPAAITANVTGKVALITRGNCPFVDKVRNAQGKGAVAVVIFNCDVEIDAGCTGDNPGEAVLNMGGDDATITIPSVFVANSVGNAIASAQNPTVSAAAGVNRDSDFDAGVISHEYGHGISNRLIGGPTRPGCVSNGEQMGEGLSDYLGLMLTQRPGDTGAQPRGVGTYLTFEPTNGDGIRPAPYSTSFAVNDFTYQDVISHAGGAGPRGLSLPHGVGFAWATMMWDVTWNLIEAHGYSPYVYEAQGAAGNQIAMNLFITGMKLTACSPGFVNARDGVFAADLALYPDPANAGRGLHYNTLWAAFARRGLGVNASQGSSASANDGTADFTVPPTVATEATADGVARLDIAGANPFTVTTALNLTVDRTQDVRVEMVDLLGRRVALLHDGAVASGTPLALRVSAAGLPAGVYVVRAAGETFSLVERVTVVR